MDRSSRSLRRCGQGHRPDDHRQLGAARKRLKYDEAFVTQTVLAQIAQMVQQNRQGKGNGDIAYNFTHDKKIERIYVSAAVQGHLMAGRLVIVRQGAHTELVPRVIADKIAERDAELAL